MSQLHDLIEKLALEAAWIGGNDDSLNDQTLEMYEHKIKALILELIDSCNTLDLRSEKELHQKVETL